MHSFYHKRNLEQFCFSFYVLIRRSGCAKKHFCLASFFMICLHEIKSPNKINGQLKKAWQKEISFDWSASYQTFEPVILKPKGIC